MICDNPSGITNVYLQLGDAYRKQHKFYTELRSILYQMRVHTAESDNTFHVNALQPLVFTHGSIEELTLLCDQIKSYMDLLMVGMMRIVSLNTYPDPEPEPEPEPITEAQRPLELPRPFDTRPAALK